MSKTLRYRLFKVGALPDLLRAQIRGEKVLFEDEGIPVTVHRQGTAPGFEGDGVGMFSGAFAVTYQRLVASLSSTVMAYAPYSVKGTADVEALLAEDGLHITVDAGIHSRCSAEIRMHFKRAISSQELATFPHAKLALQFPVDLLPKIFGVPG